MWLRWRIGSDDLQHSEQPREEVLEMPKLEGKVGVSFVKNFDAFYFYEFGVMICWQKTFTCDFFQWADEELLDEGTSMEDVEGYKLEIVKLKKKVSKLQRQLCELRSNRKWIIVTLVFSWAAMILIWIFFAVKFLGSRQGILLGYP